MTLIVRGFCKAPEKAKGKAGKLRTSSTGGMFIGAP